MNELICTALICMSVFVAGGLVYIGSKLAPGIKNFIKWQLFKSSDTFSNED